MAIRVRGFVVRKSRTPSPDCFASGLSPAGRGKKGGLRRLCGCDSSSHVSPHSGIPMTRLARKAPPPPADQLAGAQALDRLFIPAPGRAVHAGDRRVPIILAIKMSHAYADVLYKPQDYRFIGARQLRSPGSGPGVRLKLWNSVVWVFGSVILQFVFGFAAALLAAGRPSGGAPWCARSRCALDHPGSGGG